MASANSFLSLPLELRESIYSLSLPHSIDYRFEKQAELPANPSSQNPGLSFYESQFWSVRWFPGLCPAILYLNRQVYEEASELLYSQNAFEVYIKHPKEPRLPMNDGRVDPESFVLIAWATRRWCHPKNPRLALSSIQSHSLMSRVRKWHINLPSFGQLIGIDVYMRKSSLAAFRGINKWIERCVQNGGLLDEHETARMDYAKDFKDPVDELACFLTPLKRIDQLGISFQVARMDIMCLSYLLGSLLDLKAAKKTRRFYHSSHFVLGQISQDHASWPMVKDIEQTLTEMSRSDPVPNMAALSNKANEMLRILTAIRSRQVLSNVQDPILY